MPILTETISWRRAREPRALSLTPAEQTHVKAALRVLASRFGGFRPLSAAMGINYETVHWSVQRRGRPTAAIALRAARMAGVGVEEVLAGAWPRAGACAHCGRG